MSDKNHSANVSGFTLHIISTKDSHIISMWSISIFSDKPIFDVRYIIRNTHQLISILSSKFPSVPRLEILFVHEINKNILTLYTSSVYSSDHTATNWFFIFFITNTSFHPMRTNRNNVVRREITLFLQYPKQHILKRIGVWLIESASHFIVGTKLLYYLVVHWLRGVHWLGLWRPWNLSLLAWTWQVLKGPNLPPPVLLPWLLVFGKESLVA